MMKRGATASRGPGVPTQIVVVAGHAHDVPLPRKKLLFAPKGRRVDRDLASAQAQRTQSVAQLRNRVHRAERGVRADRQGVRAGDLAGVADRHGGVEPKGVSWMAVRLVRPADRPNPNSCRSRPPCSSTRPARCES